MTLDPKLMDQVFGSPQLPSMPAIALKIIDLVQQDEVDIDKIAETISLDPALSSKMLKTVNSSFYGLPKTVGSVQQAVVVLGLNSVKTLALGFSLVSNLTDSGGDSIDHMDFWRRSLFSATAAKQLCEKLNIVQAEEIFIASLLQDVGVLALSQVLEKQYAKVVKQSGGDHRRLSECERAEMGGDHAEVGGALAESWGLPPLLTESIRLHERPDEASENLRGLIRTVYAGGLVSELIENPDDTERVCDYRRVLDEWFGMDQAAAEQLLKEVFDNARATQKLFELPTGDLEDPAVILARAGEALKRVAEQEEALAAAVESGEVPAEPVKVDAKVDPTTGLPNRRQFDEHLDERFLHVEASDPLSVVFIDIDQFASVNDAVGHARGDVVLRKLSEAVKASVGGRGELYRYGEDEFTVLCPGLERAHAALLAEELRGLIEGLNPEVGGKKLRVTASIGVACYEGVFFKRPDVLVQAASKGVFAAKDGGRNRVRVFVPRQAA